MERGGGHRFARFEQGQAAAAGLKIEKAYGSYEELLSDPEIEAVYNPLPNHLHVPWSIKAAEAGKHVLCEKPIALNAAEARTLLAVRERTGVKIGEAFMVKTHPQWLRTRELIREGRIGELRAIVGVFSYFNRNPENVRHKPEWGGGGLLDIGCYPITTSRFMFGAEPLRVSGSGGARSGFRDGPAGVGDSGIQRRAIDFHVRDADRSVSEDAISGDQGAHRDRDSIQRADRSADANFCGRWERCGGRGDTRGDDSGVRSIHHSGRCFFAGHSRKHEVPVPLEDAIANMAAIDAIFRSAESGRWEKLSP